MTKALCSGYKQLNSLLGSNLRGIVTYNASKCRFQATLMIRCSILTHVAQWDMAKIVQLY